MLRGQAQPDRCIWRAALILAVLLTLAAGSAYVLNLKSGVSSSAHPASSATRAASGQPTTASTPAQQVIAQLPRGMPDHFAFGIQNSAGGVGLLNSMRQNNGTAWDFRYTELSEANAASAGRYAAESASNHYIPAFVYTRLFDAQKTCVGCTVSERTLAYLRDPTIMAQYYAGWRSFMRQLGQYGRPVLVIPEPAIWGYMEEVTPALGPDISAIPAQVAHSGDPDVAAFPDTAQGFAWALLHMRDLYAPNALLALNISTAASGDDIATSTDPLLDVHTAANTTIQFLRSGGLAGCPKGVSTWDLLASDIADGDSAREDGVWWDTSNTLYPNFTRYLTFTRTLHDAAHRDIVMWRVPEGNQFFDTENNARYHTQDNRAQYILGHVPDFARAGIVSVLFGATPDGSSIRDAARDGITNPPPIQGFGCDRCNVHISVYPDDDGGYLRLFVGTYYHHGPLKLASPNDWTPGQPPNLRVTSTPASRGTCVSAPVAAIGQASAAPNPVPAGQRVTITTYVTMSCTTAALVYVEIDSATTRITSVSVDNVQFKAGTEHEVRLIATIPAGTPHATYVVKVGVFQAGWGPQYGWSNLATAIGVS